MNPEQQNIAIAESLGWTGLIYVPETGRWVGNTPKGSSFRLPIPNYTGSLGAGVEFEAKLTDDQHMLYREWVYSITNPDEEYPIVTNESRKYLSACPLIRCEAYLRTIGKWHESNQQP